jgi:hypothetical protein
MNEQAIARPGLQCQREREREIYVYMGKLQKKIMIGNTSYIFNLLK